MSEPSKIAETVGYKRPPSHTRFKPGKSGNPRGRPRRKVNMSESLNQALDDKNRFDWFGKTLTGMEAFVQSLSIVCCKAMRRVSRRSCGCSI